ncbi:MAG: hypothetical protein ACTSX9_09460 [Candidatus Njordarchaeales archaeon]
MSSDDTWKSIKDRVKGLDDETKKQIRKISRIVHQVLARRKSDRVPEGLELIELATLFFTGYGGLFLKALKLGKFTARELSIFSHIPIPMVRKWIFIGIDLGIIRETIDARGIRYFSINRADIGIVGSKLITILQRITGTREFSLGEPFKNFDEAVRFVGDFLSLFTMIGEKIKDVFIRETIDLEEGYNVVSSQLIFKRWLEKAKSYKIVIEVGNKCLINKQGISEMLGKLWSFFKMFETNENVA